MTVLALAITLIAGQRGDAQALIRSLNGGPFPTHGWETISAESRALILEATSLEVFRLGNVGFAPSQFATCESPWRCGWMITPRWTDWSAAEKARGDWPLDVLARTSGTGDGILHYPVLGKAAKVDPTLVVRLRDALSGGRYGAYNKFCGEIEPAVGYRFTGPRGSVEVLICFRCREADVVGQRPQRLQIDLLWKPLLELAIESFPDDQALLAARAGGH